MPDIIENKIDLSGYDNELLRSIFDIILANGMKATTMDRVAATLSMSKRTLYEIFENKEEMLKIVMTFYHLEYIEKIAQIFRSSQTMMEAFYRVLRQHHSLMHKASAAFFSDMDAAYKKMRHVYDNQNHIWNSHMLKAINLGIEQGVFITDINYNIIVRLLRLQMESLKRMEEFFPEDITPDEAYQTISISFLRSIATPKGLEVLSKVMSHEEKSTH